MRAAHATSPPTMLVTLEPAARGVVLLALAAAAGRVLLAWLPPGAPGSHAPREIVRTWAASHLLGVIGLALAADVAALLGRELSTPALLAPWIVLGLARVVALPGAFVGRHEPLHEPATAASRLTATVLAAIAILPLFGLAFAPETADLVRASRGVAAPPTPLWNVSTYPPVVAAASFAALCALLFHALECARRAPLGRAVVGLLFASIPAVFASAAAGESVLAPMLLFGGGSVALVPWLRRGDRRAAALAACSFAGCARFDPLGAPFALAGFSVLLLATHANARRFVALWSVGAAVVVAIPGLFAARVAERAATDPSDGAGAAFARAGRQVALLVADMGALHRWALLWIAAALALMLFFWRASTASETGARARPPIDPPSREVRALAALLVLAFLGRCAQLAWRPEALGDAADPGLLVISPTAALAAGLVFLRGERVPRPS